MPKISSKYDTFCQIKAVKISFQHMTMWLGDSCWHDNGRKVSLQVQRYLSIPLWKTAKTKQNLYEERTNAYKYETIDL